MWGNKSIDSRVRDTIRQKVTDAQKEHDEFCKSSDEMCEQEKRKLEEFRDSDQEQNAQAMVKRIIGN